MKWVTAALVVMGSAVTAVVLLPLAFVVLLAFSLGNAGAATSASASGSGGPVNLGPPVNLGVVSPPSSLVTLDEQVAAAPASQVPCHVSASLLIAQQSQEDGSWQPARYSQHGRGRGIGQFSVGTFASYDHPTPPGGASPPRRSNLIDSVYAEARYLCSLGVDTNLHNALVGYNCGNAGPRCQLDSSGYANRITSIAERISALPTKSATHGGQITHG